MSALLLMAAALLVAPTGGPATPRLARLTRSDTRAVRTAELPALLLPALCAVAVVLLSATLTPSGALGAVLGVPLALGAAWAARRVLSGQRATPPDPLLLAGGWDLLAACLRCGLPVAHAVRAAADHMPADVAEELRTIADRLVLGADPADAWQVAESSPVYQLARAGHRSAHTGASLAAVAEAAAAEIRAGAMDQASARGQRAGVLITGPLGLCFLPAFLALGIVPVVIGLASGLARQW